MSFVVEVITLLPVFFSPAQAVVTGLRSENPVRTATTGRPFRSSADRGCSVSLLANTARKEAAYDTMVRLFALSKGSPKNERSESVRFFDSF